MNFEYNLDTIFRYPFYPKYHIYLNNFLKEYTYRL